MSLAHYSDGKGSKRSYDRFVARQIRSDAQMLTRLERSSKLYLFGSRPEDPLDGLCAKCEALVTSTSEDAFDEELERLVREEGRSLLRDLLSRLVSRGSPADDGDSQWPLVQLALVEALGDDAAERFHDGLQLLSWRNLLSRKYDSLVGEREPELSPITIPDPEIWSLSFSAVAADVCFVAVSALLAQRRNVASWIGARLATRFVQGQKDSVRLLASMLSPIVEEGDSLVSKAIHHAGVTLIDLDERYRQAEATQEAAQSLIKSHGGTGLITPFATGEEGDNEDYPDDDPDEWVPISESDEP